MFQLISQTCSFIYRMFRLVYATFQVINCKVSCPNLGSNCRDKKEVDQVSSWNKSNQCEIHFLLRDASFHFACFWAGRVTMALLTRNADIF